MKSAVLFAVCGLSLAAPVEKRAGYEVKDQHYVPEQWRQLGRSHPDRTISLRIGVKQGSFDELERQLYEVSDPDHHRYGQHLSADEVNALVAPSEHSLNAVHEWLEDNNIRLDQVEYTPAKDWVVIALPVSEIEQLLDTEYYVYENDAGKQIVRTTQYSLPQNLHSHIDVIQPTNYFGNQQEMAKLSFGPDHQELQSADRTSRRAVSGSAAAVCNANIVTSLCLRTLYNTVDYVPQAPHLNYVGTSNYLNDTANYSDFHIYMSRYRSDAQASYQFSYQTVDNGINHQAPETGDDFNVLDRESNLDIQTVAGIVYPTNLTYYSTGGSPPGYIPDLWEGNDNVNEPYLAWVTYVLSQKSVPYVITTSYGDDEQTVPEAYARRVCAEFAQLGARGTTLLFSAGDNGVGTNGTCVSNDGKNTAEFLPMFPASCPYVTVVGGTRNIDPEIVAYNVGNGYVSGGGMSNYFPTPAYQAPEVASYLASIGDLHKGLYNKSGRAYPDISAQGFQYVIVYAGTSIRIDGTSAASPTAAGVLTLVNDALIAKGKSPLGFLNPWLYRQGGSSGFNDITRGSIWGCSTSGFPAQKGWDLASGFGTPDFKKIRAVLGV